MTGYRSAQAVPELAGKNPVLDDHICFAREQQAQRIKVGRTDRGPVPVNHRHLGMQKTRLVLVDLHPCGQQRAIHRARSVVLHEILVPALQQQGHLDAAFGRLDQRAPELATGYEVGIGNDDFLVSTANRKTVGALDAVAV